MSSRGAEQACLGGHGLFHCVAKGSLVTWRLEARPGAGGAGTAELGDISVAGAVGKKAGVLAAHPRRLHVYVAGVPDGERDPGDIFLFGLANARCLQTLSGHTRKVTHLIWAPRFGLVSGAEDGTCRLWSAAGRGRQIYDTGRTKTFLGDTDPEKVCALAADGGGRLFVASEGGGVDVVQLRTPDSAHPFVPLWRVRRLEDVPKAALDAYAVASKRVHDRIERKKKEGTLGETTSEEENTRRKEEEKADAEEFEPSNKRPLAKRAGDHDNYIHSMVLLQGGETLAATTVGGEVLVASAAGRESLVCFRKSYGGSLVAGSARGGPRLYTGNRGYDAAAYEVVVLGLDPLQVLHRVKLKDDNNMIIGLHWCWEVNKLLVAFDEAGLYAVDPECKESPQTLFDSAEEHRDSMSNESALSFVEYEGCILVRTSWGRVRRFQGSEFKEMDPLVPAGQAGVAGRVQTGVDRRTGTLFSMRGGYDDYKLDTAKPGQQSWRRMDDLPKFPGWPPSFVKYVEWPEAPTLEERGMVLLGGELGGLYQLCEAGDGEPPALLPFPGVRAGNCANHVVAACPAWDAEGALLMVRSGSSKTLVFDWSSKALHGQLECKQPTLLTRIAVRDGASWLPWVAAWDEGAVTVFDLRTLARVRRFLPGGYARPWCLHGAEDGRLFAYCAADAKAGSGRLGAWRPPAEGEAQEGGEAAVALPELEMGEADVEAVTSMLLLPGVGLLVAHQKVKDGISVWCPRSGARLYRLHPAQSGTSLHIWLGPGSGCVLWAATAGGRTGYLRWNSLHMIARTHVEDGEPRFSLSRYFFFSLDVASILVNIGQILSFALHPPWEEEDDDDEHSTMVDIRLPELWDLPAVQYGSSVLRKLQGVSLPHVSWVYEFYGSILVITLFGLLIVGQEFIEARAYLDPGSCWGLVFKFANKLAKMIVQSAALPLLTYLITGFVCMDGDAFQEVDCLSRDHFLYFICPGLLAALVLQIMCFRFARVGYELSNLEVGLNVVDVTADYVPAEPEPEHPVSSMSTAYQNTNILGKVLLKIVKTLAPLIRRQGMRLELMTGLNAVVGGTISLSSLFTNPFMLRPLNCWFQPCSLQFAQDLASTWMFLCVFLATAVSQGFLPDGGWLDTASYLVAAVFPIGFIVRLFFFRLRCRSSRSDRAVHRGYSQLGDGSVS